MLNPKLLELLIFTLVISIAKEGNCCINEYRTLLSGEVVYSDAFDAAPVGRFNFEDKEYLNKELKKAEEMYELTKSLELYSDLGAMLIYNGQYLRAKNIFQKIEKDKPGLYQTAANLGTAYELLGQNDSALYWIKRGIEINPNSHNGSEWIHVKILEAKVKANGNEQFLWNYNILSLDFGDEIIPIDKNKMADLAEIRNQLYHQLTERMSFVKPKDPVVAKLLFDLGNIFAITKDATSGLQVFQVANEYGYKSEVFSKRKSYFELLQIKADLTNNTLGLASEHLKEALIFVGIFSVLAIIAIIYFTKRFRKRKMKK